MTSVVTIDYSLMPAMEVEAPAVQQDTPPDNTQKPPPDGNLLDAMGKSPLRVDGFFDDPLSRKWGREIIRGLGKKYYTDRATELISQMFDWSKSLDTYVGAMSALCFFIYTQSGIAIMASGSKLPIDMAGIMDFSKVQLGFAYVMDQFLVKNDIDLMPE